MNSDLKIKISKDMRAYHPFSSQEAILTHVFLQFSDNHQPHVHGH